MTNKRPTIFWARRDLRLRDNAALMAALNADGPVVVLFIRDNLVDGLGAAPKWRLGLSLAALERSLQQKGSRLILRSGDGLSVLRAVIQETGASAVHWTRLYDPDSIARDKAIKAGLGQDGITAESHAGHVLFEPWNVQTGTGGYYRVFTPMWRAVRGRDVPLPLPGPEQLPAPENWPVSEVLEDWQLGRAMNRGADVCLPYQAPGEEGAQQRLSRFLEGPIHAYQSNRDLPGNDACSALAENLALGEISIRQCWHAGQRALQEGSQGAESWLRQLVWRDFAWHLIYHTPHIVNQGWREGWETFAWNTDENDPHVLAWKQGRTGIPFVDAAMREMYVTGRMHNRARMITASYLTKHLLMHWRVGQRWFETCLTDWDPANNAMGWQWVAGSGPDASPYFRIFNPETQAEKFDPKRQYRARWLAELAGSPTPTALKFYDAIPRRWALSPKDRYPSPIVELPEGRKRALEAYESRGF